MKWVGRKENSAERFSSWQERQELYELYSLVYHDGNEASDVNDLWWKIINKSVEPLASMNFRRKGKYFLLKDLLRPKVEFDDLMTKLNCACWHHFKPERAKDHIKADLEQIRNDAKEIGVLRAKIRIRRKQIEKTLDVPRKWLSEPIEKENLRIERRLKEIYGLSVDENPQEGLHRRHILTIAVMVLLSHYTTLTLEAIRQCIAQLLFELGIADAEDEYELGNIEEALKKEYSKDRQNFRAVFRLAKDLYEKTV